MKNAKQHLPPHQKHPSKKKARELDVQIFVVGSLFSVNKTNSL